MPAILELPEVRERVSTLTVDEYHRLDEFNEHGKRTGLIRGIVIEKLSKSPLYAAIAKRLYDFLLRLPSCFPDGADNRAGDKAGRRWKSIALGIALASGIQTEVMTTSFLRCQLVETR
jgi:hypothetical protein